MSTKRYLPVQESKKVAWIQNFSTKLPTYATKYGILPADIADVQAGATAYLYWIDYANKQSEYSKKMISFKSDLANGTSGTLSLPVVPVFAAAPALPASGIFRRISSLVDGIKKKAVYTQNDGLDLGIEGSTIAAKDSSTLKPKISARIITDGHPEILWTKGDNQGIEIQTDKGNGTWQFLGIDLKPNYTDNSTLPAPGKTELWRYRAIYIDDENHIGLWSDVTELAVIGM